MVAKQMSESISVVCEYISFLLTIAGAILHVEFLETSRVGRHLIWNGYTHRQNNKRDTWISWKCIDRNCKATLCTRNDVPSKIGQPYNHLPDHASVKSRKILESVRSRWRSETTPIPSIYDEEITKLRDAPWDAQTLETAQKLPTFESKRSSLYRTRNKLYPGIPNTRPRIQLEGKFRQTTSREPFLQAEDGDINKLLIFTTAENLRQLCTADTVYCDGTFYTAPPMFDSIFTIHAFVGTAMFPLVYSLLPQRDAECYIRLFNLLKNIANQHNLNFHPNKVSLDFECASRNAVSHVFPNAELKGCLFHYAKAIWKKTQEYGLQTQYKDVPDVNKLVRRAAALPLLPLDRFEDYWLHALENAPQSDACTKLTDYIVLTWLEGTTNLELPPNRRTQNK
ncbi:uncharacterized protein LOC143043030 [Mytilus galloprovincialis]|uniref:uncharacterized protein LOC143043030 n=1 Tax=Mytilus galloprovincialis TaxID=29158 RepID=UPI003F7C3711